MQFFHVAAGVTYWDHKALTLNLQGRNCATQLWNRPVRKRKVPTAVIADEVILKILLEQIFTPRQLLATEFFWLTRWHDSCLPAGNSCKFQRTAQGVSMVQKMLNGHHWLGRGHSTTLACHLSKRSRTANINQAAAGPSPDLPARRKTQRKTRFKGIPWWALPLKAENNGGCGTCYPKKTTVHATLTQWWCNYLWNSEVWSFCIVAREGQCQGSQSQKSPTSITNFDFYSTGLTMDGQSKAKGQHALKFAQRNVKESGLKRQNYTTSLKDKATEVCWIQETN